MDNDVERCEVVAHGFKPQNIVHPTTWPSAARSSAVSKDSSYLISQAGKYRGPAKP